MFANRISLTSLPLADNSLRRTIAKERIESRKNRAASASHIAAMESPALDCLPHLSQQETHYASRDAAKHHSGPNCRRRLPLTTL
jgi:hypothetical protein